MYELFQQFQTLIGLRVSYAVGTGHLEIPLKI